MCPCTTASQFQDLRFYSTDPYPYDFTGQVLGFALDVRPYLNDEMREELDHDYLGSLLETEEYYFGAMKATRGDPGLGVTVQPGCITDNIVLGVLVTIIVGTVSREHPRYFSESCFSEYDIDKMPVFRDDGCGNIAFFGEPIKAGRLQDYYNEIRGWGGLTGIMKINLSKSLFCVDRSRLIQKVAPLLLNHPYAVKLFTDFLNARIYNEDGPELVWLNRVLEYRPSTGIPPLKHLSRILFNILIDDIDKKLKERMPDFHYVRYNSEIVFPLYNQGDYEKLIELFQILKECNFDSFIAERAGRECAPIFIGCGATSLRIDRRGRCRLGLLDKFAYTV